MAVEFIDLADSAVIEEDPNLEVQVGDIIDCPHGLMRCNHVGTVIAINQEIAEIHFSDWPAGLTEYIAVDRMERKVYASTD